MKRLVTIAIASIFAIGAHAQNAPATNSNTTPAKATVAAPATATKEKMKDGVMMKDGKMWMTQDGKTTAMDKEMTMKNGTKVMPDGSYVTKDGKKMKLANGDSIDKEGKVEHPKAAESKTTGTQPKK